ncbi:MAG: hypothetical protein WC650_06150 [Candidatus Doudnabacteria bacterium]
MKRTVLALCGLFLCLLLSGCKERQKEMSATYWEAVNVAPANSGQIPPNTWKTTIKDGKNMFDVDQEVTSKIGELLRNHPGYHVAKSNINLEIKVTIAPNSEKREENEKKD